MVLMCVDVDGVSCIMVFDDLNGLGYIDDDDDLCVWCVL